MICDFRFISEWDTTLMFMTAFASDQDFLEVFLSKTSDASKPYLIKTVYRSKLETDLGETDLQVNYVAEGKTHKTDMGFVDLSIAHGAEKLSRFQSVEKWLHESGHTSITVVQTQKSATFRINVPEIHMWEPFESWDLENLNKCLEAEMELSQIADMFSAIRDIFE